MKPFGLRLATVLVVASLFACDTEQIPIAGDTGKGDVIQNEDATGDLAPDYGGDPGQVTDGEVIVDLGTDQGAPIPYVSARITAEPLDMADGDNAYGIRGKSWVLENQRVRFIIQDAGVSVHLNVHGGNLIDADLRRGSGEAGRDQFREFFPLVGFRVNGATKVEVVDDGSDGKKAVIRVTGTDQKMGILDVIDDLADDLGVTIRTDYILEPDLPWVKIRTEVENPKNDDLEAIPIGDFISLGGASQVFRVEGGFTDEPVELTALISTGGGASYGYTVGSGMINVPYQEINSAITLLGAGFDVKAKGKAAFDRYLVVGRGDVSSVLDAVQEIRGVATVTLSGKVTDEAGVALSGAKITVFRNGEAVPEGGGTALTQAFSGEDGEYSLNLPAGTYDVVASAAGRLRLIKSGVDISQFTADFKMDAAGRVGLDIQERDENGDSLGHIPAKISLTCKDGGETPWADLGENERHGLCAVLFSPNGGGEHPVKPGHYQVVVSRGIEYETVTVNDLEVKAGQTVWIEEDLLRSLDTAGYLSGDFHQHTVGSLDSETTHVEKVVENLAEGVEIAAITDHDNVTSYAPAINELGAWDRISSVSGDEVTNESRGHFNMFEPEGDQETLYPILGAKLYVGKSIVALLEELLTIPGVELIQMNHPRSFAAYLSWIKYDPVSGVVFSAVETMAWGFHSIEVQDSIGTPDLFTEAADPDIQSQAKFGSLAIPVMRDWFSMLNQGRTVCAVGNSDAHNRNDGVGYSRNFLRLGTDKPAESTTKMVIDAIMAQKNVVSNGPFLKVLVEDPAGPGGLMEAMGHTEVVKLEGADLAIDLTVSAPSWIDVASLEIYANGRPVHLMEVAGVLLQDELADDMDPLWVPIPLPNTTHDAVERLHTTVHLYPKADTWYVFLVRGIKGLEPVGNGTPYAYTNPLYVDADGDGIFSSLQ